MSLGRLVVTAVKVEGLSKSQVAREYGVSRRWVHELVRRFEGLGSSHVRSLTLDPTRDYQPLG